MKNFCFTLFALLFIASPIFSQQRGRPGNVNYISLANRAAAPVFHFDQVQLPADSAGNTKLVFIFRLDNNFLPFKKITFNDEIEAPSGSEFYSSFRLNTEIFEGKSKSGRNTNYNSVTRDAWQDTVFAASYEETKSRDHYNSGYLVTTLKPGQYNYLLQLSMMGETNERNSQRQDIRITDFDNKKRGSVILLQENATTNQMKLMNMGNRVLYGKDFSVLVDIPAYNVEEEYQVELVKVVPNRKDTTELESIYVSDIKPEHVLQNQHLSFVKGKEPGLELSESESGGLDYALISIPNASFENNIYRIKLTKKGETKPFARRIIRSYWPNMPPALLSLDIATDMLKFIISEEQLKEMKKGNAREKEEKFRKFWSSKDPTPDTEYNELMTEYYRRVDYSFREFSNPQNPFGQDTDQGSIYIKFGPPLSKERVFPEKGRVLETWNYPNRKFVFEKGSGFSEFVLLGTG